MVSVIGSVRLPTGEAVQAVGVATVRPRMLVGVDVQGSTTTLAQLAAAFAAWPSFSGPTKLFWSANKGAPTWTGKTALVPSTAIPHLCWFDPLTVEQIRALLDAMPSTWREVWLTPRQEGDRTMTPAAFKAAFGPVLQAVAGHPARRAGRVRIVVNLTEYFQRVKNNNGYAAFIPSGLDPALDYLGADVYPGGQSNWTSAATVLAGPVAAADAAGLKLVIPEFGLVVPTNPTAAQLQARAAWYRDFLDQAERARVVAAGKWEADGDQTIGTAGFITLASDPARGVLTPRLVA
jgi:hypothetical protein